MLADTLLLDVTPVFSELQVSIVPRGAAALGFAQYLPNENMLMTTEQMLDMTCMALGGRAAEQVMIGKISTGRSLHLSASRAQIGLICACDPDKGSAILSCDAGRSTRLHRQPLHLIVCL